MISIRRGIVLFMLGSVVLVADDIQIELQKQIDQIVLVDESNSSKDANRVIVGCDDRADPVEKQNCYKESATAILTQLSSNETTTKVDDIKAIKAQLSAILMQLAKLEKQQLEIIKNREKSLKKSNKPKPIVKSNTESNSTNVIEPKKIKILEETAEYTKIEVQRGENLSFYAKQFYNDNRKYRIIYNANRDKISIKSFEDNVFYAFVELYKRRWTIEECFKELKSYLSFEKFQVQSYDAIMKYLHIILLVHTLTYIMLF